MNLLDFIDGVDTFDLQQRIGAFVSDEWVKGTGVLEVVSPKGLHIVPHEVKGDLTIYLGTDAVHMLNMFRKDTTDNPNSFSEWYHKCMPLGGAIMIPSPTYQLSAGYFNAFRTMGCMALLTAIGEDGKEEAIPPKDVLQFLPEQAREVEVVSLVPSPQPEISSHCCMNVTEAINFGFGGGRITEKLGYDDHLKEIFPKL
jgi:hypothetical protein